MDFEYGADTARSYIANTLYNEDSVLRYRTESIEDILNDSRILSRMIMHHYNYQVPRLNILESYYLANNAAILNGKRRNDEKKADYRVRHAFADVISNFLNSYVLANPVKIDADQDKFIEIVENFNKTNDIDAHNLEIGKDQNNMGRAYELIQRTAGDEDKLYRLDPREVFMIYDLSVRTRVIGACRYYRSNNYDPNNQSYKVELYTHDKIYRYNLANISIEKKLVLESEENHLFGGVPIIEYRSDRHRMATYEKVLSQIDAYDAGQSDTANYMTDFNDAILVIEGMVKNAEDGSLINLMKDANILMLIPQEGLDGSTSNAKASYLTKSYDVQGVESYKSRIRQDIFSLSSTPDLSDESFGGTRSGESLKYKMFGLEQKRSDKEKFLMKGFRVRYKLLENIKRQVREYSGEPAELKFTFTPNLPKAVMEELQTFINAGGQISNETKLAQLSFVDNVKEEVEKIQQENSPIVDTLDDDWGLNHEASKADRLQ